MKPLSAIRAVKLKNENTFLNLPGITGVDIGRKISKGKMTDETAIRIYVTKKLANRDLPEAERIPKEIDGVKTDVIERRYVLHQAQVALQEVRPRVDTQRYTTLRGGMGIGPCTAKNGYVFVGTLGCFVKDRPTGATMMLTNYHVLA